jgi:signal transduction histidine kinase
LGVAGEGTGARRRARRSGRGDTAIQAVVELLARGLGLERAAVLVDDPVGGGLVPIATWGRVRLLRMAPRENPPDGPWSAVIPITAGGRTVGSALLALEGGRPLAPAGRSLARRVLAGAGALLAGQQLEADAGKASELLARADRLTVLGTLAAGIAHEVRNPLVSVRTFIELLPERLHDEEFRTEFRQLTLAEIERICRLLNDLLAFARPSSASVEPSDANALALQIVRLLEPEARTRAVSVHVACAADLPLVLVDEGRLKQVLMNLVLNAIEACSAGGDVHVTTIPAPAASCCTVEVADTGAGIPPAVAPHLFDPFVTTKDTGSGLGLYIAHRIVTEHGGTIHARPAPGGGTVFSIRLPAVAATRDVGTG